MEDEKRLEFIYKAIEDTTNTIRALDTKINYVFVAIGLVFALMGVVFQRVLDVYDLYKAVPWISGTLLLLLIIYAFTTVISVWFGYKTLIPKNNPEEHVDCSDVSPNKLWYLVNNKKGIISISLKDYYDKMENLSISDLVLASSFELLKASYIRNIKLENSKKSIFNFIISVFAFTGVIIILFLHYFILKG
ncbi:hypothetical protein [Clostridium beijerinckii]|uniref:hypothetical protein n=1 Tax=Clostridium beijerinckii TaxID=1520 RepID=UPI0012B1668C|nr:hypothetical protein [Clostridium beijerinckii]MRY42632.1 hypothetical protein [Parabacteroides distasonis]MZK53614.1 hypothetical protein [Clostridium beijerinckii]MZK61719.1 hypothetical protein [Clostridium beijerinckii]MZK71467.1 hypothetical protein [Clostridium beijerinckii]MZK76826.1 hypothetical protein [Clostridium beijerinckii]